tara:strand:- start:6802 stop:7077 length:276 start_codon:yes stop_codon:yes gene_type:complete
MEFKTIAILDEELFEPKVRNAGAYQFTDYITKKINIIAPIHLAEQVIEKIFHHYELINIFDKYYLITSKGKTEITEMEYNELKSQISKRHE